MKVKYYRILWGDSTPDLCEKVNADMKFGWQPIGGATYDIANTLGRERNILIQAMVQYESQPTTKALASPKE